MPAGSGWSRWKAGKTRPVTSAAAFGSSTPGSSTTGACGSGCTSASRWPPRQAPRPVQGARSGRVRGSPKRGRTLVSKRVMAQIRCAMPCAVDLDPDHHRCHLRLLTTVTEEKGSVAGMPDSGSEAFTPLTSHTTSYEPHHGEAPAGRRIVRKPDHEAAGSGYEGQAHRGLSTLRPDSLPSRPDPQRLPETQSADIACRMATDL